MKHRIDNAVPFPKLSQEYLEANAILPLCTENGLCFVATWSDATGVDVQDDLRLWLGAEPSFLVADEADIRDGIRRLYAAPAVTAEALAAGLREVDSQYALGDTPLDDLRSQANEAPVVRLVNLLIVEALEANASDVHLESLERGLCVRYRIDGVLLPATTPPEQMSAAILSRVKIMAELDIAERRIAQDGRIRLRMRDRDVDVRVSVLPTHHGESIVLRLLDKGRRHHVALDSVGLEADMLNDFRSAISRPSGIVLVTGPTGSGKTTTLYGALQELRTGSEKILTVEDPVEYELTGICQVPVNAKVAFTFAAALRAMLRQDPDIVMVGEIRDRETAEIAMHAAMTGHLVLSTLHTNDAPSAVARLLDLGIDEYIVAGTLEAVLAQRLVRKV